MLTLLCPCPPSLRDNQPVDDAFRFEVAAQCRGRSLKPKKLYRMTMTFYGSWSNADGTPRRRDAHNFASKLLDVLAAALGVDDSQFRPLTIDAVHRPGKEHVVVEIS